MPTVSTSFVVQSGSQPPYHVHVAYPRLVGLPDAAVEASINSQLRSAVTTAVSAFVENVTALAAPPGAGPGAPGPGSDGAGSASALVGTFATTRLDRSVASFSIRANGDVAGAAQPSTVVLTRTFDLATGSAYSLASLFRPGSPYLATLSNLSIAALQAKYGAGSWAVVAGPEASNFADWALSPGGLQLTFPNAPQALTAPVVTLPYASLVSVASPGGPLG